MVKPTLLDVKNLAIQYTLRGGVVHAIDGISFEVKAGECFGLVGESGCGKSTAAKAILGLWAPNAAVTAGEIIFNGRDLLRIERGDLSRVRWKEIALIPQNAMNALDPVYTIFDQIYEAMRIHKNVRKPEARERIAALFRLVGLKEDILTHFPHQLSGGMKQRVCIAMALALEPQLVIADEPTTALDVLIQDQILQLIKGLQIRLQVAVLYISHDISIISHMCTRIAVMYAGRIVELGDLRGVLKTPYHPYTMGLLNATPSIGQVRELISIPGVPPDLRVVPKGCRFAPRCPFVKDRCRLEDPDLYAVDGDRRARCFFTSEALTFRELAQQEQTWK
jgi:oligopeptide/dipeptide ABC transporter ATP-binding protein